MKKIVTALIVIGILFASCFCVSAIGFDAEKVYESIFVIKAGNSLGSGFAVGENVVITNHHVIDSSDKIVVETYGGEKYNGKVYASDENLDIAIIIVESAKFVPLKIGDDKKIKIGDDIYTVGAPNGMTYTLTKGAVSAKDRELSGLKYIQIDAPINSGNSGGPLLNDAGEVLGINTLKLRDAEGIGLAIPMSVALDYLKKNGVAFDANNSASVTGEKPPESPSDKPQNGEEAPSDGTTDPKVPYVPEENTKGKSFYINLGIVGGALIVALIAIVIVYKKSAGKYIKKPDPSERTDFEIEIEE